MVPHRADAWFLEVSSQQLLSAGSLCGLQRGETDSEAL